MRGPRQRDKFFKIGVTDQPDIAFSARKMYTIRSKVSFIGRLRLN